MNDIIKRYFATLSVLACFVTGNSCAGEDNVVVLRTDAEPLVKRAGGLLVQEAARRNSAKWRIVELKDQKDALPSSGLLIVLETPGFHPLSGKIGALSVTADNPGLEGCVVKTARRNGRDMILIGGSDPNGLLYGVGKCLRHLELYPDKVVAPPFSTAQKPRFPIRGYFDDAGTLWRKKDKSLDLDLFRGYMEDMALSGMNLFMDYPSSPDVNVKANNYYHQPGAAEILKGLGLKIGIDKASNYLPKSKWPKGIENPCRHGGHFCPSIPEGRKAILDNFRELSRSYHRLDLFLSSMFDPGGCGCGECGKDWLKTHLELTRDIKAVLKEDHPEVKVTTGLELNDRSLPQALNELVDYIKTGQAAWLDYGGIQIERYDITKWIQAGLKPLFHNLYTHWDKGPILPEFYGGKPLDFLDLYWNRGFLLRKVYSRRGGPTAMPMRIAGYIKWLESCNGGGVCANNFGRLHDDFNKFITHQLLLDPNADVLDLCKEYARYYFGPKTADRAGEALMLMETNWARPVVDNPDIVKVREIFAEVEKNLPETYRAWNWRYCAFQHRALMDRMAQIIAILDPKESEDAFADKMFSHAASEKNPDEAFRKASKFFSDYKLKTVMPLVEEIKASGEKCKELGNRCEDLSSWHPARFSDQGIQCKIEKCFNIDWLDIYLGLFKKGIEARDPFLKQRILANTLNYQYPGENGCYDISGDDRPAMHPRLQKANNRLNAPSIPYSFPNGWRLSQSLVGCAGGDDDAGHTQEFVYTNLDPKSRYRLKITEHTGVAARDVRTVHGTRIYMGGNLVEEMPMEHNFPPLHKRIYDLPPEAIADGKLVVSSKEYVYNNDSGISEIWVYKYDGAGEKDRRGPLSFEEMKKIVSGE